MKRRLMAVLCALSVLFAGCWDRLEVEDQIFLVILGIDKGETQRYRVTARAPVFAALKSGILGGIESADKPDELIAVEADSVAQAIVIMNASVSRRISMRHLRAVVVGEALAREGLEDLLAELLRNPTVRSTIGFSVARGTSADVMRLAQWTGEVNPAKVVEGVLLVEKQLHMAPPSRLHHMLNRAGAIGVHPFASVLAVNPQVATGQRRSNNHDSNSALGGELNRLQGNPVEVAGTAVFRDTTLVGFLNVDETQSFLALRGEMGKAYITIPNPYEPDRTLMLRFQQENLPKYQATMTSRGPRVRVRLIFEGEILSGHENYRIEQVRIRVEESARRHIEEQLNEVLRKLTEWRTDPVGFGLLFRSQFATWSAWEEIRWSKQLERLQVEVEAEMRIRRHGLTLGAGESMEK